MFDDISHEPWWWIEVPPRALPFTDDAVDFPKKIERGMRDLPPLSRYRNLRDHRTSARSGKPCRGRHLRASPQYLHQYANQAAWLKDNRRTDNGTLARTVVSNSMDAPVSRQWKGYWQR